MKFMCLMILSAIASILLAAGCKEKRPDGMPDLIPVVLTVTQEGAPLAEANINFYAQDSANKKWGSGGVTDAQGKLVVMTQGKYKGMPAGKYKITVSKILVENPPQKESDPPGKYFELIEKKYTKEALTDIMIEVAPGTSNYDIKAGKAVKEKQ